MARDTDPGRPGPRSLPWPRPQRVLRASPARWPSSGRISFSMPSRTALGEPNCRQRGADAGGAIEKRDRAHTLAKLEIEIGRAHV